MGDTPNVSNSLTIRVQFKNDSGMLGLLTSEIGRLGGDIGSVDLISVGDGVMVRDLTINCRDDAHAAPHVRIMATGRSDYPNQVNNVLAFPGV
ncbi:MAG: hypothetical protein OSB03_15405, partial [Vicinamibacterales bacterium]|nr:hypothetical protein [Vicinamibacterales bacterium]